MKLKTTMAVVAVAFAPVFVPVSANAAMIHLEVSGDLAYGQDRTNVFGLGLNTNLAGRNATFFWNIDSTRVGPDRDSTASIAQFGCGMSVPGCSYFMTAGVTINGVTRMLGGTGSDQTDDLRMYADTDGTGLASADSYYLRAGQTRYDRYWYLDPTNTWYQARTQITSKVEIQVQDRIDSILSGLDPLELNAWSTTALSGVNDSGSAVFNFSETDVNGVTVYEFATGGLDATNSSVRWWTGAATGGTGGTTGGATTGGSTVPEPGSLALVTLGLGMAGVGVRRRRGVRGR